MKSRVIISSLFMFLLILHGVLFSQTPTVEPSATLTTVPAAPQIQPQLGGSLAVAVLPVRIESPHLNGNEVLFLQNRVGSIITSVLSRSFFQVYGPADTQSLLGAYVFSPLVQAQRNTLKEKAGADVYVALTVYADLQDVDSKDAFEFAKQIKLVQENEKPAKEGKSLKWNVKDFWIYKPWISFDIQFFSMATGNMVKRYQEAGLSANALMVNASAKDDSIVSGIFEISRLLFPDYLPQRLIPELAAFDEKLISDEKNKDNFLLLSVLSKNYSLLSQFKGYGEKELQKSLGFAERLLKVAAAKNDAWSLTEAGILYRSFLYPATEDKTTKKRDAKLLDTAQQLFLGVTKKFPSYRFAHFNLAGCYRERGMTKEAVDAYKKFLRLAGWAAGAEDARNYIAEVHGKDKKIENLYMHSVLTYCGKEAGSCRYDTDANNNQSFAFKSDKPLHVYLYWNFSDKPYDVSLKITSPKGKTAEDKFQTEKDKFVSERAVTKEGEAIEKGSWKIDVFVGGKKAETIPFTVQ